MDKNKAPDSLAGTEPWHYRSGPLSAGLLITLLALIIYLPVVNAPFVLDDEVNIIKNTRLHDFSAFWPPLGSRHLAYLTFAVNYSLGGLKTAGYHIVNIIIHILTAMTLYGLVRTLFSTPALIGRDTGGGGRAAGSASGLANHIAFITALLFTAHPINTQAVIYTTQRFTIMASLFYLLSLYLYLKWRMAGKGALPAFCYVLSIISALAASKSKEISFTLPFVILLAEYLFFTEPGRWVSRRRLYPLLPYAIVLIIIPLSILGPELGLWGLQQVVDDGFTRVQQVMDIKELSSYSYLMTEFTVVPKYIRLFFLPVWQNLDYDYPLYHSFLSLRVMAGFCFLLILFVFALLSASFARRENKPLLLLAAAGLLWFFITLSVESTVIPIRDVIFEHRMYLPGAGLSAGVAATIVHFLARMKRGATAIPGRAVIVAALIIIIPLTALALSRALIWADGVRLYEDIVRKSPEKARARNNLGALYATRGEFDKAIAEFQKSLTLPSDYPKPYKNLARALYGKGDMSGAMREYRAAIGENPGDYQAHQALAFIYRENGLYAESEKEYNIVLSLVPWNTTARVNLANIYIVQERFAEAVTEFQKVLKMNPGRADVYFNLAIALESAGRTAEALYYYKKFLAEGPAELSRYREKARARVEELGLKER